MSKRKTTASLRREKARKEIWPAEEPWTGEDEIGWFPAPRTLPLLMSLISSKGLSGRQDPGKVYLELLARHYGEGVVELTHEAEHAYCSGYSGPRAVRTWGERLKSLEELGLVRLHRAGGRIKYALLVHPTAAIHRLRAGGRIPDDWWNTYTARQRETKEPSYQERQAKAAASAADAAALSDLRLPAKAKLHKPTPKHGSGPAGARPMKAKAAGTPAAHRAKRGGAKGARG